MEIIGRLTADAQVITLKDERQFVRFSIAINDYYKTKNGDKRQLVTYVNCSYWVSIKVATVLTKGTIVSLFGRIGVYAYNNMENEAQASLTFHVNSIVFFAQDKKNLVNANQKTNEVNEDLPF